MPGRIPLPDFLIIGAQKGATRWLRKHLGSHPDVYTATRELEFFNHHYHRGIAWYAAEFDGVEERLLGEATPGYMFWRERPRIQAARIDGMLPGVKLLAVLRNPMDRARSAFLHHIGHGRIDPSVDPIEWIETTDPKLDELGIVSGGWYGASLAPYVARFGNRLCVLLYDDVLSDAGEVYRKACDHVGGGTDFVPQGLGEKSNSGTAGYALADPVPRVLEVPTAEFRGVTYHLFEDDIVHLEGLLGQDLSMWKVSGSGPGGLNTIDPATDR